MPIAFGRPRESSQQQLGGNAAHSKRVISNALPRNAPKGSLWALPTPDEFHYPALIKLACTNGVARAGCSSRSAQVINAAQVKAEGHRRLRFAPLTQEVCQHVCMRHAAGQQTSLRKCEWVRGAVEEGAFSRNRVVCVNKPVARRGAASHRRYCFSTEGVECRAVMVCALSASPDQS